jgi:hypothetical protein
MDFKVRADLIENGQLRHMLAFITVMDFAALSTRVIADKYSF